MPVNHITRTEINIGARTAPLIARVNRRAKRLIVKVDPVAGEILVTAPSKRTLPEAIAFAQERAEWIAGQLDDSLKGKPFAPGAVVPYCGVEHVIVHSGGPRTPVCVDPSFFEDASTQTLPPPAIRVGGDEAHVNRRLTDWLKREARKKLTERADYYADRLGKKRGAIRIRDTRSRWGSCTSDGALSFSWRLILTPPHILDYVAAHECAHLIHMNHSPAFWRILAGLGVDARGASDWFRINGPGLFAYGSYKTR